MNFWQQLPTPTMVLAPLADVTDAAFRRLIAKYSAHERADGTIGGPDVMWTEFVSADGLARAPEEGRKKLLADLVYSEKERPIVAQLFSSTPDYMEAAARLCAELGFDGIDINMGCPDRSIEKQGCGSAMIKNPARAREIIRAAKRGAGELPVSVKTRLGYNHDQLEEWLPELLAEDLAVVTVHARTRKEMSKVPARWERIARAVAIRDERGSSARIFGNGDAYGLTDAHAKVAATGADGVMLGRAIFGNPWLFHPSKMLPERIVLSVASSTSHHVAPQGSQHDSELPRPASQEDLLHIAEENGWEIIGLQERLTVMIEHTQLFEELLPHKNFAIMKKHYKAYVNGFDGAKELRMELMDAQNAAEVATITNRFLDAQA